VIKFSSVSVAVKTEDFRQDSYRNRVGPEGFEPSTDRFLKSYFLREYEPVAFGTQVFRSTVPYQAELRALMIFDFARLRKSVVICFLLIPSSVISKMSARDSEEP
jgi:tRNA nucleotidyltransferase (CCA-adding enzyme)